MQIRGKTSYTEKENREILKQIMQQLHIKLTGRNHQS
jgi:hypothetical protein